MKYSICSRPPPVIISVLLQCLYHRPLPPPVDGFMKPIGRRSATAAVRDDNVEFTFSNGALACGAFGNMITLTSLDLLQILLPL